MKSYILLLGSSFIKKMDFNVKNYKIINQGISRLTTEKLFYLDILHNHIPSHIIFYCGNNDLILGIDKKIVYKNLKKFINILLNIYPTSKIIIIGLLLSPLHIMFNKKNDIYYINYNLYKYSNKLNNVYFININSQVKNYYSSDKIHLNKKGYAIVYDILRYYL
jgi:lysophospholipase L1-like esterase